MFGSFNIQKLQGKSIIIMFLNIQLPLLTVMCAKHRIIPYVDNNIMIMNSCEVDLTCPTLHLLKKVPPNFLHDLVLCTSACYIKVSPDN